MKHPLLVAVLSIGIANDAFAQGMDVHTRYGPSGSHFTMSPSTQTFFYEATVSGGTNPFQVELEVYHNGVLKFADTQPVPNPTGSYLYSTQVGMQSWGLSDGDSVEFVLKVIDMATGATVASHILTGDVAGT